MNYKFMVVSTTYNHMKTAKLFIFEVQKACPIQFVR